MKEAMRADAGDGERVAKAEGRPSKYEQELEQPARMALRRTLQ